MNESSNQKLVLTKNFFKSNPLFLKRSGKKRVVASSFIVSRKESHPIYSMTQKFHLISRPAPIDSSMDISMKLKMAPLAYDYTEAGTNKFFSKQYKPPRTSPKAEFPNIRRKIFTRMCKGGDTEANMVPYTKRIKTKTDLTILKDLIDTNKDLKSKILEINKRLNKSVVSQPAVSEIEENFARNEEKANRRLTTATLCYVKSDSSIPVKDSNWQKIIRRTADGFKSMTTSFQVHRKVKEGIVDVSYPYCKSCKREWLNSVEIKD